jgi:hypothetical protein
MSADKTEKHEIYFFPEDKFQSDFYSYCIFSFIFHSLKFQ